MMHLLTGTRTADGAARLIQKHEAAILVVAFLEDLDAAKAL